MKNDNELNMCIKQNTNLKFTQSWFTKLKYVKIYVAAFCRGEI